MPPKKSTKSGKGSREPKREFDRQSAGKKKGAAGKGKGGPSDELAGASDAAAEREAERREKAGDVPQQMQAAAIPEHGKDPSVITIAVPSPGPGELLVRVRSVSVNPVDFKMAATNSWWGVDGVGSAEKCDLPLVLGSDVSGEVAVSNSPAYAVGDEVYFAGELFNGSKSWQGANAEYVTVAAAIVDKKPAHLSHAEAAALPLAGCTALDMIDRTRVALGDVVLVHAGSGGVGHLAIQICKAAGATVVATCSAASAEFVKGIGADFTADYKTENLAADVLKATGGAEADVVLDTVGGDTLTKSAGCLKHRGRTATIAGVSAGLGMLGWKEAEVHNVFFRRAGHKMRALSRMAKHGQLKPAVQEEFEGLAQVGDAWNRQKKGGMQGKLVIHVSK